VIAIAPLQGHQARSASVSLGIGTVAGFVAALLGAPVAASALVVAVSIGILQQGLP
jgi:hypothetical protein